MTAHPALLTSNEAAAFLRVSQEWVTDNATALGGVKLGRHWTFTREELTAYRERQRVATDPVPVRREPKRARLALVADLGPTSLITGKPFQHAGGRR